MFLLYLPNDPVPAISGEFCPFSGCDIEVDEGGDGGVGRGDGPLHCISLRQCSALAISAANQDGSSGSSHVNADRNANIMC